MSQMTLGFHGQLNRLRKQHVAGWGLGESGHMDSIPSAAQVCEHKGKVPGTGEYRVSEVSKPIAGALLCEAHGIGFTVGLW